jgi:hypothetical protein
MKTKKIIFGFIILFHFTSSCQTTKGFSSQSIEKQLTDFLISNNDIQRFEVEEYKSGKSHIKSSGIYNEYDGGPLKDGIYVFNPGRTHSRSYFVIIEKEKFTILDISTRKGLEEAIKNTLDFCERSRYCQQITKDYVSRLIGVYYNINANPDGRADRNCVYGVTDTKDLP